MLGKKVADFTAAATGGDVQAVGPQGRDGRALLLPEGQHARLHDRRRAVPRRVHGSSARPARSSSACSRDSLKSHEGFKAKMSFPFELLSDADEKLCAAVRRHQDEEHVRQAGARHRAQHVRDRRRRQARARVARRQGARATSTKCSTSSRRCDSTDRRAVGTAAVLFPPQSLRRSRGFRPQALVSMRVHEASISTRGRGRFDRPLPLGGPWSNASCAPPHPRCTSSPPASRPRPASASATKLFVLDTNVLMHDPDEPVPLRGARHLPADAHARGARQQQEGHDRSRAQRAPGEPLPRRARDGARRDRREHREGHSARRASRAARRPAGCSCRPRAIATDAAGVARRRQGGQPDPRAS